MRRFLVTMVAVLIVVVGGFFAMDRASAAYAESQIAKQVTADVERRGLTSQAPAVTVGGFPFLTQVASGQYEEITIELRDLSNGQLTLPLMTIVATGVEAPLSTVRSGSGTITANMVTGTSAVPWSTVVAAITQATGAKGITLSGDDSGQVHVAGTATFAGLSLPLTGSGKASISNGKVLVKVTDLKTTSTSVNSSILRLIDAYKSRLTYEFSVPKMPYGLKLTEVRPTAAGVQIRALAEHVPLGQ